MFKCKIIADSCNPGGNRITTFVTTYPAIIHAEHLKHRMMTINSSSYRAVPFNKIKEMVLNNPFVPIAFPKTHKGMHTKEYMNEMEELKATKLWIRGAVDSVFLANNLHESGVSKQICNRMLTPYTWMTVISTVGESGLRNFFELRCPKYNFEGLVFKSKKDIYKEYGKENFKDPKYNDKLYWYSINDSTAEIHIQEIAEMMYDAYKESTPALLNDLEYHIPYKENIDAMGIKDQSEVIRMSVAMIAHTSYTPIDNGKPMNVEKATRIYDQMFFDKHATPFEHVAQAVLGDVEFGPYKGFKSLRYKIGL